MSKRYLSVIRAKQCIGCQLCVLASSRVSSETLGLSDGFISVSSQGKDGFDIAIDQAKKTDYEEIVKICPRRCFEITNERIH